MKTITAKNDEFDYGMAGLHLVVALIFGLFFLNSGQLFKFILMPYIVLIFLYPKKEVIPGLTIMMCYGTILTTLAAVVIFAISFTKIDEIKEKKIYRLWLLLTIAFPFYLFNSLQRIFELNYSFVESLIHNDYYIAFWFLLFGALNAHLITRKSISFFLFVSMLIIFIGKADQNSLLSLNSLYRLNSVSENLMILFLYLIFRSMIPLLNDIYVRLSLVIFVFTRLILGLPDYKFTFLLGVLISLSFVVQKQFFTQGYNSLRLKKVLRLRSMFFVIMPIPFLFITLFITPLFVDDYAYIDMNSYYNSSQGFLDLIFAKLFVDRGLLWTGAITGIIENANLLPPVEEWFLSFNNINDYLLEVNFEAHNLLLELIRKNGYVMGVLLSITYLRWQYKLIKSTVNKDLYMNVFRYAIFGVAIAVFTTGQYTLLMNTSFYFMMFTGALANTNTEVMSEEALPISTKKAA